jgi:hypothetical protein
MIIMTLIRVDNQKKKSENFFICGKMMQLFSLKLW